MHHNGTGRKIRRGASTLEAILVVPIIFILTIAVAEFGVIVLIQNATTQAAVKAAREAAKADDATERADAAEAEANRVMAVYNLSTGADMAVLIEDGAMPEVKRGTLACSKSGSPSAGYVRVTVCVSMTSTPFIGGLKKFGIDFMGKAIEVSAVSKKEFP